MGGPAVAAAESAQQARPSPSAARMQHADGNTACHCRRPATVSPGCTTLQSTAEKQQSTAESSCTSPAPEPQPAAAAAALGPAGCAAPACSSCRARARQTYVVVHAHTTRCAAAAAAAAACGLRAGLAACVCTCRPLATQQPHDALATAAGPCRWPLPEAAERLWAVLSAGRAADDEQRARGAALWSAMMSTQRLRAAMQCVQALALPAPAARAAVRLWQQC